MSNGFFNATGKPIEGSEIASAEIREEFTAIAAGFDKLPTLTGNAYKIVYVNASGSAMDVVGGAGLLKLSTTGIPTVAALGTGVETALGVNVGSAGAPVLFNGAGGTPSSMTGTNISGTAAGLTAGAASAVAVGGITGLGTGVATALAVNVGSAGAPVVFNGAGGTPSSMTGTNITGTAAGLTAGAASAVAVGGITGLGTGVATALAVNVGSAGAPVVFNGAGGTPSSMTGTNISGTAAGLTAGAASAVARTGITGLGTGIATALGVNVGSAGAPVLFNGAGGTPSSMTGTNITGLPTAGLVNDAVTYAKMQNVSATDKLLGRSTAGAGDVEEIACTAAGRAILDDADATAQRATLGLVIGTNVQAYDADTAKLDVAQAFTAAQTFQAGHQVTGAVTSGYGTGAGGAVTQATSRTTGVTLNKPTGAITMFSAAGASSWSSFVVTNSLVAATDTVILSVKAGATNLYNVVPFNITAGAFSVAFASMFGTATDAPVINFAIIKGAAS